MIMMNLKKKIIYGLIPLLLLTLLSSVSLAGTTKFPGRTGFKYRFQLPDDPLEAKVPQELQPGREAIKKFDSGFDPQKATLTEFDKYIGLVKGLRRADPTDLYYQAILGSLLVAKNYAQVKRGQGRGGAFKDRADKARGLLDHVLETDPDRFSGSYYVRGIMYLLQEKFTEALADFYSTLLVDVENNLAADAAVFALGRVWHTLADEQKRDWAQQIASKMGERLVHAKNKTPHDYLLVAKVYYLGDEITRAAHFVEQGLELESDNRDLLLEKGLIAKRLKY